jgi:hypothetical protein
MLIRTSRHDPRDQQSTDEAVRVPSTVAALLNYAMDVAANAPNRRIPAESRLTIAI